jgi:DNA-binding response OmpR family regulator
MSLHDGFVPECATDVILAAEDSEILRIIESLRKRGAVNPILVIRPVQSTDRTSDLLFAGADDDMVSPLTWEEIEARAKAILRRIDGVRETFVRSGDVVAFEDGRPAEIAGKAIDLSPTENILFRHLLRYAGRYVTRSAIHDHLYGLVQNAPCEKVVDVHICNIRRKIRAIGAEGVVRLETSRGVGYRIA